ncbi:MAG: hypothetical protein ACTSXL_05480 [Alphaproteobacteria bacterium]|nr:MAG: hypothetical protein B6I23_00555 [Rickettsiaceae bacterium 4572_127]
MVKKKTKLSSVKAKKTVRKVKQDIVSAEKKAEKRIKKTIKRVRRIPQKAKNYSTKKAKIDFKTFITDARDLLLRPKKLFESIKTNNDFDEPIVKAGVYGLLAGIISVLVGVFSGQGLVSLTKLISLPILSVFITFGAAGILLFISYLANGKMDFEASVKAVSSKIFLYPIIVLLSAVSITFPLLVFSTVLVDMFLLYLGYSMIVYCLNADLKRARIIFGILGLLMLGFYLTDYSIFWFMKRNFEVGQEYFFQKSLGMHVDMDTLKNLVQ